VRVAGHRGGESADQAGIGETEFRGFAEPCALRIVQREAATGGAELAAVRREAGVKVRPGDRLRHCWGEEPLKARDELLIGPVGPLRRTSRHLALQQVAHHLPGCHVALGSKRAQTRNRFPRKSEGDVVKLHALGQAAGAAQSASGSGPPSRRINPGYPNPSAALEHSRSPVIWSCNINSPPARRSATP